MTLSRWEDAAGSDSGSWTPASGRLAANNGEPRAGQRRKLGAEAQENWEVGWLQRHPGWKVFKGSHWGAMSLTPGHLWAQGEGCRTTRETTHGCPLLRVPWSSVDVRDRRGSQAASSDVGLPPLTAGAMQPSHTIAGSKAKGLWGGRRVYFCPFPSALSLPRGAQPEQGTRRPWPCPSPAPCGTLRPATSCFPPWTDPQATSIRASWVDGGILHPLPFRNSEICEDIIRKYRTRPFVLHDDPHVFISVQAPSSGPALGTVSPRCGQQGPRPASSSGGASPAPRGSS